MAEGNKQNIGASRPETRTRRKRSSNTTLHPREVMLIRQLWFWGWDDYQIWKEYRIPIPVIQKAKDEIEIQATEEFENKESHAVELAKLKERLMFVVDTNDAITKDPNVSHADRLKSESIKLESLAMLRDIIEASNTSPDPQSALKKIVEQSSQ